MAEKSEKQLVVGILAHVDSGKTTLSEAMLYRAGSIRRLGRVDNKDAFLDTDTLEKARGITIFSKQALLKTGRTGITLLDTPGHVDFSTETERTLQVLDYAVLVVSGTDGVQSHTETLWRLLRRYHIPTFVFINKMVRTRCRSAHQQRGVDLLGVQGQNDGHHRGQQGERRAVYCAGVGGGVGDLAGRCCGAPQQQGKHQKSTHPRKIGFFHDKLLT